VKESRGKESRGQETWGKEQVKWQPVGISARKREGGCTRISCGSS
jgi:hypothetical protein